MLISINGNIETCVDGLFISGIVLPLSSHFIISAKQRRFSVVFKAVVQALKQMQLLKYVQISHDILLLQFRSQLYY